MLVVLLISMIIVIPIGENNPTEIINTRPSQVSSVYYENMNGDVSDFESSLTVIDVSSPTNPGTPVYEDITRTALGVYVSGDSAYVACRNGLAVIDVSDPTNPGTHIFEITTGDAYGVYVSGDYAYVADGDQGLAVIQVRKSEGAIPFELIIIALVIGGGAVMGVAVVLIIRRKRK